MHPQEVREEVGVVPPEVRKEFCVFVESQELTDDLDGEDLRVRERRGGSAASDTGVRVPVSGRAPGDAPDIEHPLFSVEVKARAKLPVWIEGAMRQAESCAQEGKIPVVILHEDGRRCADALVMCRLSEFVEFLNTKRGKFPWVTQQVSAR